MGYSMSLKATINMATATLVVMSILFAFFTWSSKSWVEGVNAQILDHEHSITAVQPRLTKIETENTMHWSETERRLSGIEVKLDKVLSIANGR